jgi:hypothetical protein
LFAFCNGQLTTDNGQLSNEKMERGFAEPQFVSALKDAGLARRKAHGIVNYSSVDGVQIFNQKCFALAPDARMTPRDFSLWIEAREIYLRENI